MPKSIEVSSLSLYVDRVRGIVNSKEEQNRPFIIAIDGRCASGKTTLASLLGSALSCPVVHTDDFYLPLLVRSKEIMQNYYGHMDLERLRTEVLVPLSLGEAVCYSPFSCKSQSYLEKIHISSPHVIIIEGTYSLFPTLSPYYDLRIFLDTTHQKERLLIREGEDGYKRFAKMWIPREEEYFLKENPKELSDLVIEN